MYASKAEAECAGLMEEFQGDALREARARRPPPLYCSVCGKTDDEVRKMVAGFIANICGECVLRCVNIIDEVV